MNISQSSRTIHLATLLLLISISVASWSAWKMNLQSEQAPQDEILYIQSPRVAKLMSLGYTGLAACIYWTRAVQYFGEKNVAQAKDFSLLPKLLDLTVSLDPQLMPAYKFGAIFLAQAPPYGAGMPDKAVEFAERGIKNIPDDWRLYYHLGFIHYMERHDYKAAAEAFERGNKVAGNPPWMNGMPALMLQHAGDIQTARILWTKLYEQSDNDAMRKNALIRLVALRVDDDVIHLEQITRAYFQRTGAYPSSWQQLIAAGMLGGVPADPSRTAYRLMPGGRVVVQDPQKFPFIQRGLPEGRGPNETITPEAEQLLNKSIAHSK